VESDHWFALFGVAESYHCASEDNLRTLLSLTRLLASFLYDTSATDLMTFIAVPVLSLLVSAVACFIPARLVTSIDRWSRCGRNS
jgi:hypothetical protein